MAKKAKQSKKNGVFSKVSKNVMRVLKNIILLLIALGIGSVGAYSIAHYKGLKTDDNLVALRIGNPERDVDYDYLVAIDFLEYKLKEAGFKVAGRAYAGDLYPEKMNNAGVNIFIRGYRPFFDLRMNKNGENVYYMHRNVNFYAEEMRNYDYRLTAQKKLLKADNHFEIDFMPVGYVPREKINPSNYEYDLVYIYEFYNDDYDAFIQRFDNVAVYNGMKFARLSDEEKKNVLSKAKAVVYEMGSVGRDDETYVPYAVFDIMSYGRPLITNRKPLLDAYFSDDVWLFDDIEGMKKVTTEALNVSNEEREVMAEKARYVMQSVIDVKVPLFEKMAKNAKEKIKNKIFFWRNLDYIN